MHEEVRARQASEPSPAIESVTVAPRKADVTIRRLALAWVPQPR